MATFKLGVGGPGYVLLNHFGGLIFTAFGEPPYLVGSATQGKVWRDVDVRLILADDRFNHLFGDTRPFGLTPLWCLVTAGISALGQQMTGLPIDFQIQPQSHADEHYNNGFRQPLGIWTTG